MRFLLDENVSPQVAVALAAAGHDAVHVRELGLSRVRDEAVLTAALDQDRVVVSADADFGELLASEQRNGTISDVPSPTETASRN